LREAIGVRPVKLHSIRSCVLFEWFHWPNAIRESASRQKCLIDQHFLLRIETEVGHSVRSGARVDMLDQHPTIEPRTRSTAKSHRTERGQSRHEWRPYARPFRSAGVPQVTPRLQRSSHAIHLLRWMPLCCRWCFIEKKGAALPAARERRPEGRQSQRGTRHYCCLTSRFAAKSCRLFCGMQRRTTELLDNANCPIMQR